MSRFYLGSSLKRDEIEKILSFLPLEMNKERTDILKEILIRRKIAPVTAIRKIHFYCIGIDHYEKLGKKESQILLALKEGVHLHSFVSFMEDSYQAVFKKVDATYIYGNMDKETHLRYIEDLDKEFGNDIILNLYESTAL